VIDFLCLFMPETLAKRIASIILLDTLHPLMERALKGEVTLLFMDATHFVMGWDFLGYIYGKARRLVKIFSGRQRYNALGALDFATKRVMAVTNDAYIRRPCRSSSANRGYGQSLPGLAKQRCRLQEHSLSRVRHVF